MFNCFSSLCVRVIFFSLFILFCVDTCNNLVVNDGSVINEVCGERAYLFVATVDGNLTALDFDTGVKCWSIVLDSKGFISSGLSKLEVWENGTRVWLIPSLDGTLFKFDKIKLEPLPLNTESFLTQSTVFDQSSSITAGKFKLIYGICRHTGEVYYKCSTDGCENYKQVSSKDILIIEQMIQCATAIDSVTAENRWHFRVAEMNIKTLPDLTSSQNTSFKEHTFRENALMPYISCKDFHNVHTVKISLANGYTARVNESFQFAWLHKTSSPILDVWYHKDNQVELLDPFTEETDFFTMDSDDGAHVALLFLGSFRDQLFVKQSKTLKTKVVHNYALSRSTSYEAYCFLKDLYNEKPNYIPAKKSNALTLYTESHGYYFYINFTVYNNGLQSLVDFQNLTDSDRIPQANFGMVLMVLVLFIVLPIASTVFLMIFRRKKQFANEGTSTIELSLGVNESCIQNKEDKQDFISRFHKDFQLITILGKGGFGVVMEVKNNIDDCDYAVKRIRIRVSGEFKELGYGPVMREVKALAKLDHPGVVRYFNSWVEYPPKGWQELKDQELDIVDVSYSTTNKEKQLSESQATEAKKNSKPIKIAKKLRINPLNPYSDDFLNFSFGEQDLTNFEKYSTSGSSNNSSNLINSSNDSSNNSLCLNDSSDTLSLNNSSKQSISQLSLCYDYEVDSDISGDAIIKKQIFYPRRHTNKISKLLNGILDEIIFEYSCEGCKVSDIRTMFNIPSDLFIDKDAAFLHLKKINKCLAWCMNFEYLNKLYRYIFHDSSCSDPDHSEWSRWSCILQDIEPDKVTVNLDQFQNWLISVLCILRHAESHYHNLLLSNLSNILWEVNRLLEKDICLHNLPDIPSNTSLDTVGEFFYLKIKNDALAWPMKFIYLFNLRHYIFCNMNCCPQSDWKSVFYQGDICIYRQNLCLFQVWIISILCEVAHGDFLNTYVSYNLCTVLNEVNLILQQRIIIPTHSTEMFFSIYGNLLTQPKNVIQLEDRTNNKLLMFHNSNLYEKPKRFSAISSTSHQATKEEDIPGFLYIQMQLCRRESLRNWLDTHSQNRNYAEIMNMFHQIVDAMAYVHAQGLMHRDLKPSNIYFSLDGSIKIGDFGLATQFEVQVLGDEALSTGLGYHTRECGTELYMSPEQRSKKCYNYKTDIFSLGIILYELLVPFITRSERYKAIYAARDRQFSQDFIKQYPKECLLVQKLLDNEPKRRPTASEIKKHPLFHKFQHLR